MAEQKTPMQRALPGLLVAGSLGGVGLVMVSLLSLAPPVQDGSTPLAAAKDQPTKVEVSNAGAFVLPATVGPGGKNAPLTPARLDAPPPLAALPVVAPIPAPKTRAAKVKARPSRIKIPKIKVNAPVGAVTVNIKGKLGTPPLSKPNQVGWYRFSPVPGEAGPSIINGHVATRKGPAVFDRLRELAKGDHIYVYRSDGKVTRYTVSGIEQASKTSFPTNRVYGNTNDAQLRLITCGGVYNKTAHSYTDNIVVYATLSKKKG
ncbi:LPXTG-site transpeptidase (sortase) family protein [Nonomuraea solani]|uniref:LPXTG-site transpeptidase (Sortase) family protein n=1 Tax=Nonomuraea solani TaxID=1144553 RepID=A0A1H6ESE2_9ACTN|nr:class F sortase [Nonomuraea solani]SEH00303.1 LPXTG-site transpeptidase (sortase) family protein [Nonomuraea solani]